MLRNKDFWIGLLVGLLAYYLYTNHVKKGPGQ
jgi:hypothetical protein